MILPLSYLARISLLHFLFAKCAKEISGEKIFNTKAFECESALTISDDKSLDIYVFEIDCTKITCV